MMLTMPAFGEQAEGGRERKESPMRSQSTHTRNGRQAEFQGSSHSLCRLVQEQLDALCVALDREACGLRQAHAGDVRRQLRLLLIVQDAQERLAGADRKGPRVLI
jgi:hypothetical protein